MSAPTIVPPDTAAPAPTDEGRLKTDGASLNKTISVPPTLAHSTSASSLGPETEEVKPKSEKDLVGPLSKALEFSLRQSGHAFCTFEGDQKRSSILADLQKIVNDWVRDRLQKQGESETVVQSTKAALLTYGSYRLNIHSPTGDIDLLVIIPSKNRKS